MDPSFGDSWWMGERKPKNRSGCRPPGISKSEQRRSRAHRWFDTGSKNAPPAGARLRRRDQGFGRSPGGSGRLRNAPPPQGPCLDRTTLFALLQSDPVGPAQQSPARGSKLRRRLTWVRRTFPAWPGARRHVPHPASLPQLLVCNLACGAAMGSIYSLCRGRG